MTPRFHPLRVADVRRETPDAVSIAFEVPEELKRAFCFDCGQYLTLKARIDGEEVRRSYSICSGRDEGEIRVAVKRVEGGLFSAFVNETLAPGDVVEVMTPMGRFTVEPRPEEARVLAGFASGSGITPILSIIKTVLAAEPKSRFFLFYGNRSTSSILFRETLENLKDRFLDRLSVFHVLSRETQDIEVLNGRLDSEKARLLLRSLLPAAMIDHAFVCGPADMIDGLEATLIELGLPRERVHVERFTPSSDGRPRPARLLLAQTPATAFATIILDGSSNQVPVAEGETVLEAAIRGGLDLPYSCRGGMCCTCRAKVVEGTVAMEVNYSLEAWETKAGFALTCQARPTSERVTVDFDQV
jgi:ring-1,2-phenylacetyl-CoA epoxidase subunit PaaE